MHMLVSKLVALSVENGSYGNTTKHM